jgi:hypothetical protein
MRRLAFRIHTTLDGFIATADGRFWDSFSWGENSVWGEEEMAFNNEFFRSFDTWVLGPGMLK